MHLLLTRPTSSDDPLPELLRLHGHTVVRDPLLRIELLPVPDGDIAAVQALVVTSSNALRAFQASSARPRLTHLPVFAVGAATAAAARSLGFADVRTGDGRAGALLPLLTAHLWPTAGHLLYLRGEHVAVDLEPQLVSDNFTVRSQIVYRAIPARSFAAETVAGFVRGLIEGVVLLSPRTAETYAELAEAAGLARELAHVTHFCLSPRIAEALAGLDDVRVRSPSRPEVQELVALIDLSATQS